MEPNETLKLWRAAETKTEIHLLMYDSQQTTWPLKSHEIAYELWRHGIAPLPVGFRSKKVLTYWKRFQGTGPSILHMPNFFRDGNINVAAMCGPPSDNMFVIDADTNQALDWWIRKLNYPNTWVVESSRGGHIYLRSPFPVAYRAYDNVEIRGCNSYVLAPGSIHPDGTRYTFIHYSPQIKRLAKEEINEFPIALQHGEFHANLPRLAKKLMRTSETLDYGGRGRKEFAIVMSLSGAGFNDELILYLFENYLYSGSKFGERGQVYLDLLIKKAKKYIQDNERTKSEQLVACYELSENFEWPNKRTATTDRNVYVAHLIFAKRYGRKNGYGKYEYGVSERDLAEESGYQRRTINKANKRLIDYKLLELEKAANFSLSSRYSVMTKIAKKVSLNTHSHGVTKNVCEWYLTTPKHDIWRTRSGPTKHLILTTLRKNGNNLVFTDIVNKTQKVKTTISRNLKDMIKLGLVYKKAKYYCITEDVDLDEIAKEMGTHGKSEKQRAKHRIERINQHLALNFDEQAQ